MAAAAWVGVGIVVACSSGNSNAINCGDGSQECGGACTVIARDSQNCGACGKACTSTEICSAGSCTPAAGGCTMGTTKCGNECTNTQNDPRNCGSCGKACAANEVCMAGACASSCGMGTMKCGMSCVSTQTDRTNCGMCGTMCKDGEICTNGMCGISCQQGLTKCNSSSFDGGVPEGGLSGDFCTNVQTDNLNCGGCGVVCGGACLGGTCASGGGGATQAIDSMPGASTGSTSRGAGNACGTRFTISQQVTIKYISGRANLTQAGNVKFLVFNGNNAVLVTPPQAAAAGDTYKLSGQLNLVLAAGTYDIGVTADQQATYIYDQTVDNIAPFATTSQNPNWTNYANPTPQGNAGVDCAIRLYR